MSGSFTSKSNKQLRVISQQDWPKLRDLYKRNWPQHILSYYTLKNFIEWGEKNPAMDDVQISTTDGLWHEHGTYILEDRNEKSYYIYFNTLSPSSDNKMLSALQCLDIKPAYTLTCYVEQVRVAAEQHLSSVGITQFEKGFCPTSLYYLPKESCLKLKWNKVPGFVVKPLTEQYVNQIDDVWPYQYPGSDYYIRRIIRYNLTLGAFEEHTARLCAWVMLRETGTIGILQVDNAYKRRGLAELVVRLLSIKIAESGMDVIANAMDTNEPSCRLFEKLNFRKIDRAYWYDKSELSDEVTNKINSDCNENRSR